MSEWPFRFQVAKWEFQRFVKPNQLVISFVLTAVLGLLGYGLAKFSQRADARLTKIAVIGGSKLGLTAADTVGRIALTPAEDTQLDSLRKQVTARKLEGILVLESADSARLIVRRNVVWRSTLETHLSSARRQRELGEAGLAPQRLADMLAPVKLSTEFQGGNDGRVARILAVVAIGLVLYGLFTSMAYILVSVTAEKQLRVTEQVISAISAQTWIDGKILGITAVALVNVMIFLAGGAVWILGRAIATKSRFSLGTVEPMTIVWILVFAMLGFLFWLSIFGAVAATVDDPNTSTRGPLMFLPALFSAAGFMIIRNPDSTFARIMGYLPLTSSAVMPARVALSEVPWWELLISVALLAGGTLLARRAAGKVFSVAMLMYGKEPSWMEIRRWVGESGGP